MSLQTLLLMVAVLIVLILAAVAAYYQWRLHQKRRNEADQRERQEEQRTAQVQHVKDSIMIISRALLARQVDYTEASIRISVLAESLQPTEEQRDALQVFYKLAEETSHIPILDNWKKLPAKEKKAFEKERQVLENKYEDFILDSAKKITERKVAFVL